MCQCTTTWYGILDLTAGFLSAHGSYGGSVSEVENNMGCDCEACGKELFISPIHSIHTTHSQQAPSCTPRKASEGPKRCLQWSLRSQRCQRLYIQSVKRFSENCSLREIQFVELDKKGEITHSLYQSWCTSLPSVYLLNLPFSSLYSATLALLEPPKPPRCMFSINLTSASVNCAEAEGPRPGLGSLHLWHCA